MYLHYSLSRLIGAAVLAAVVLVIYLVLEVIDRLTASRAMRTRVNEGSDKFFAERGSVWQAALRSAIDFFGRTGGRWF